MCYEKCVHTLSRSCHAVCHGDLTSHMIPGGPPWGMVWKSMKFCAQVQNFKTIALSVQEIWAFLLLHALKCEHISHSSIGFSWSHATSEALDGPNEIFSLKSRWICLWECLIYHFIAKYKPSTQKIFIKCCKMLWKCCKNSIFELFSRYSSFFLCSINL